MYKLQAYHQCIMYNALLSLDEDGEDCRCDLCGKGNVTLVDDFLLLGTILCQHRLMLLVEQVSRHLKTREKVVVFDSVCSLHLPQQTALLVLQVSIPCRKCRRILIVGKVGEGMRSCKCTSHDLYVGGCHGK